MCGHVAGVGSPPLLFKGHPLPVAGDCTGFGNLDFPTHHIGLSFQSGVFNSYFLGTKGVSNVIMFLIDFLTMVCFPF